MENFIFCRMLSFTKDFPQMSEKFSFKYGTQLWHLPNSITIIRFIKDV